MLAFWPWERCLNFTLVDLSDRWFLYNIVLLRRSERAAHLGSHWEPHNELSRKLWGEFGLGKCSKVFECSVNPMSQITEDSRRLPLFQLLITPDYALFSKEFRLWDLGLNPIMDDCQIGDFFITSSNGDVSSVLDFQDVSDNHTTG